jgi:GH25 family lysozyme M1 (1,4-beta-N-acetylmuramidase)
MLHLPDVSEFQPNVDWAKVVRQNGGAAVIRAMAGTSHIDKAWYSGARRADAHKKGILALGIYQYLEQEQDAVAQAQAFVQLVGSLQPGEFAIVDIEEGSGDQSGRAQAWLDVVDSTLTYPGYKGAWLYSGQSFYKEHGLLPIANSARHTWVASYGSREPADVPHTLWQHTDREPWPGIGNCDCSIYNGDLNGLLAAISAPAKPARPVAPPVPAAPAKPAA